MSSPGRFVPALLAAERGSRVGSALGQMARDLATLKRENRRLEHENIRLRGRLAREGGGAPPPADDALHLSLPASLQQVPALRDAARAYAVRHDAARPDDVAIAVHEACANAVRHAYEEDRPGLVVLTGTLQSDHVAFEIEDHGRGFLRTPRTDRVGLGLSIIARLADRFELHSAADAGTRLRLAFRVSG